jgi:hypothetical protein
LRHREKDQAAGVIAQQNNVAVLSIYGDEYFRIWPKICQLTLNIVDLFNLYFDIFSARPVRWLRYVQAARSYKGIN